MPDGGPPRGLIRYRDLRSYGYVLAERAVCETGIRLDVAVTVAGYVHMAVDGTLLVAADYAWDGPSGPALDTPSFMRASLFHDALYQLMRARLLGDRYRAPADALMRRIALEDGMSAARAWWTWAGVRAGGGWAAKPRAGREAQAVVRTAP